MYNEKDYQRPDCDDEGNKLDSQGNRIKQIKEKKEEDKWKSDNQDEK